jgi:hypothetical protein
MAIRLRELGAPFFIDESTSAIFQSRRARAYVFLNGRRLKLDIYMAKWFFTP